MKKLFNFCVMTIFVLTFTACSKDGNNDDFENNSKYGLITINDEKYEPTSTGEAMSSYFDVYLYDSSHSGSSVTSLTVKFKNQKFNVGDTVKEIRGINWQSPAAWNNIEYEYTSGSAIINNRKEIDNSYGSKDDIITVEYKNFTFENEKRKEKFVMNGKIDYVVKSDAI